MNAYDMFLLGAGTLVVFLLLFYLTACIMAHDVIVAAKQHDMTGKLLPTTWVIVAITIIMDGGFCLMVLSKFLFFLGVQSPERGLYLILMVISSGIIWLGLLKTTKRIVFRLYPGTIFQAFQDIAIETLGEKRIGKGYLHNLL